MIRQPSTAVKATFVEEAICFRCHADVHAKWRGSHHELAMALPTPETVRGDFDDATITNHGITSRFFRKDGKIRSVTLFQSGMEIRARKSDMPIRANPENESR